MKTKKANDATVAYQEHLRELATLLRDAVGRVETLNGSMAERSIDWADVGSMGRTRELAIEMAWTLGAITAEDAKAKHGVTL